MTNVFAVPGRLQPHTEFQCMGDPLGSSDEACFHQFECSRDELGQDGQVMEVAAITAGISFP
jgi:hypothetical protein